MRVERDTIGNVVDVIPSNVDKVIRENETLVRLCNYMDVYNNRYLTNTIDYNSGSVSIQELVKFSLRPNDVIITKDSETPEDIAVPSVVVEEVDDLICGYHLALLRPKENRIDGQFLMHLLQLDEVKKQFSIKANGSTRYGLTIDSIKSVKIKFPASLTAQRKIARMLRTVDGQIEKTEAIIAKYKAIKQGLMQDLFTRGIDVATGKLRPRYQDSPELYKPSPLGMIPKEWEVSIFKAVVKLVHGYQFREFDFTGSGTPVIKIGQVKPEGIDLDNCSFISSSRLNQFEDVIIKNGDVLMALTGATLGKTCIVRNLSAPALQNYRVGRFDPILEEEIDKTYLYYLMSRKEYLEQIFSKVNTGAQGNIGKADFEKTSLLTPPFSEQTIIATNLSTIDSKIEKEKLSIIKLQQLKKGLMSDLLSGKVRVQVNEEAVI